MAHIQSAHRDSAAHVDRAATDLNARSADWHADTCQHFNNYTTAHPNCDALFSTNSVAYFNRRLANSDLDTVADGD